MKTTDNEERWKELLDLLEDKEELDEQIYHIRNIVEEYGVFEE